jgi:hypothetical protein
MKDHYNAVRMSNLYEHCGISKPLLMLIAGLIIGPLKEGEDADPELPPGWCIASQDTLGAMIGCSVEEVNRQVAKFERDGWLTVKRFRDDRGYPRYHYAITPEQLKNIKTREMKKDEDGYYIRAKRPLSARRQESQKISQKNLVWNKPHPLDDSSSGHLMVHQEATCESIKKPLDNPSMKLLQAVVPLLGVSSSGSTSNGNGKSKIDSLRSPKEGKKNQSQNREAAGNTSLPADEPRLKGSAPNRQAPVRNYLKDEPAAKLRDAGCPDEAVAFITKLEHWSNALNNTSNPITAYVTLALKENGPANKLSRLWMPQLKTNGVIIHGDPDFYGGLTESDKELTSPARSQNWTFYGRRPCGCGAFSCTLNGWSIGGQSVPGSASCERRFLFTDGDVTGVDDLGSNVDPVLDLEGNQVGFTVLDFVESGFLACGALDVGKAVVVIGR